MDAFQSVSLQAFQNRFRASDRKWKRYFQIRMIFQSLFVKVSKIPRAGAVVTHSVSSRKLQTHLLPPKHIFAMYNVVKEFACIRNCGIESSKTNLIKQKQKSFGPNFFWKHFFNLLLCLLHSRLSSTNNMRVPHATHLEKKKVFVVHVELAAKKKTFTILYLFAFFGGGV